MGDKLKYYFILHLIVLVWGFTGVIGDEISIGADAIAFYRMAISFLSLFFIGFFLKKKVTLSRNQIISLLLTGGVVGLHWFTFFLAIKLSTVSLGVVCMSSATLFTSIIEPLVFKRKFLLSELFLSFAIILGIIIIFGFESEYYLGIITGLISASLAATFTVLNGKLITGVSSFNITKYEMLGGSAVLFLILLGRGKIEGGFLEVSAMDWFYLVILGILCTTVAFMVSVWVMKFITPFSVSMSINMEPIYTILIVLVIDFIRGTNDEKMSVGFYVGTLIILTAIFLNAYLKKKARQKGLLNEKMSGSV